MKQVILFLAIAAFAACNSNSEKKYSAADSALMADTTEFTDNGQQYAMSYWGTLPCSGCSGTETTLEISGDFQKFRLHEKKQGTDKVITIEGNLNTERGFENDPDATVYILNHDKPADQQRFFVRSTGNDNELKALDKNRKLLPEGQNTLRRMR